MTYYSYISLSLRVINKEGEEKSLISFGPEINPGFSGNALELFVNTDEVFVFDTSGNQNVIALWYKAGDNTAVAMAGIEKGVRLNPLSVVNLLRECVKLDNFNPIELFEMRSLPVVAALGSYSEETTSTLQMGLRTFTSTAALTEIVTARLNGEDREAAIVIAVSATAVPVEGEETLVRLRTSTMPDFYLDTKNITPKPESDTKDDPRKSYYNEPYGGTYSDDEDDEEFVPYPTKIRRKRNRMILLAIFLIIALAAGWTAVKYLPRIIPESVYDKIQSTDVTEIASNEAAGNGSNVRYRRADRKKRPGNDNEEFNYEIVTDTVITDYDNPEDSASVGTIISDEEIAEIIRDNGDISTENAEPGEENVENAAIQPEPTVTEEVEPVDRTVEYEAADVKYLNSHRIWKRSELKSEKYREVFDLFGDGNIRKIVNNDYFAVKGRCNNSYANKAVTLLWEAIGTDTQLSNTRTLKKLAGKDKIDMWKLMDDLSRIRSPKPNKRPRPKR